MNKKAKKILLIENDQNLGTLLVWALASGLGDNAVIEVSNTCDEAFANLNSQYFDLVISEKNMLLSSGLELLTKIREIQPGIPLVLISESGADGLEKEIQDQFDGFISKPVDLGNLYSIVRESLENVKINEYSNSVPSPLVNVKPSSYYSPTQIKTGSDIHSDRSNLKSAGRILIMEDDSGLRRIYKKALSKFNYKVFEAGTLQVARDLLDTHAFDIFICDIHLGSERGSDLLLEKSEQLEESGTQVIMCSSYGQYRYLTQEMGADFFLEKPISLGTLLTLVSRLMDNPQNTKKTKLENQSNAAT